MLAIIGGSGLEDIEELQVELEAQMDTPYGPTSAPIRIGHLGDKKVAFLARHGRPHTIPPHKVNYRANLWALKELNVRTIIAVNAVGGISQAMDAGVISVPDQIIDYTCGREHTYSDSDEVPLHHIDFTYPYTETLRQQLLLAAKACGQVLLPHGTYGVTQGPRLETAAEIRRMASDGCDMVGMTAMPEAALAAELGLDYACIAVVANKAAGCIDKPITIEEIHQVMNEGLIHVKQVIASYVAMVDDEEMA